MVPVPPSGSTSNRTAEDDDGGSAASHPDSGEPSTIGRSALPPGATLDGKETAGIFAPVGSAAQLPELFGRYRIIRLLGRGGMGSVYLARDAELEREVALKIPFFRDSDGADVALRFVQEARAAAALSHVNICPIYDVGEINGVKFLSMAFIDGRSLADFVKSEGGVPPRQAILLVRKLALALEEAHRRGIVHRDLKPGNIMVNRRSEPIIMDFGLARRLNAKGERITANGLMMGTPAYMPPEQMAGKIELLGPNCDVYSLGVVFYELLTGKLPFRATDLLSLLSAIATEEPAPLRVHRPQLDPMIEAVCLKAIAKKLDDRYQSMTEFAAALSECLKARASEDTLRIQPAAKPAPRSPASTSSPIARQQITASPSAVKRGVVQAPVAAKRRSRARTRRWNATVIAVACAALVLLVGYGGYRFTDRAYLVFESDDPTARVLIQQNGLVVEKVDLQNRSEVRLRPGVYDVEVERSEGKAALSRTHVALVRGERAEIALRRASPPDHSVELSERGKAAAPKNADADADAATVDGSRSAAPFSAAVGPSLKLPSAASLATGGPTRESAPAKGLLHSRVVNRQPRLRSPLPASAEIAKAEREMRRQFAAWLDQKEEVDRLKFAAALHKQAWESTDPATRFVLRREAATVAAAAGEPLRAMVVLGDQAAEFDIDEQATKSAALAAIVEEYKAAPPRQPEKKFVAWQWLQEDVAEAAFALAEDACRLERYEAATAHLRIASAAGTRAGDDRVRDRALRRSKEVGLLEKEKQAYEAAKKTLNVHADDPAANLTVGRFLVLARADWRHAFSFLAKSNETGWQGAAVGEMKPPSASIAQIEVGDWWWNIAAMENDRARAAMLKRRACLWYRRALQKLSRANQPPLLVKLRLARTAPDFSELPVLLDADFADSPPDSMGPNEAWSAEQLNGTERGFGNGCWFFRRGKGRAVHNVFNCPVNFACEVVGRLTGEPARGWQLVCRPAGQDRSLKITVCGSGELEIESPGGEVSLPPIAHPAIRRHQETNVLLMVARGRSVEIYVNGEAVVDPLTLPFEMSPAQLALGVDSGRARAVEADFTRFTVWPCDAVGPLDGATGK